MLHLLFLLRNCNSPYRLCTESTFVSKISEKSSRGESVDAPRTILIPLLGDVGTREVKFCVLEFKIGNQFKKQERPR